VTNSSEMEWHEWGSSSATRTRPCPVNRALAALQTVGYPASNVIAASELANGEPICSRREVHFQLSDRSLED
jgi:hypothetical protein